MVIEVNFFNKYPQNLRYSPRQLVELFFVSEFLYEIKTTKNLSSTVRGVLSEKHGISHGP